MNVLLIDNVASTRAILRHLLECIDIGICLHEFDCPEEALDWCLHIVPDAVVIDNHLPNMHGLEFANLFRLQPEHRDVPILLVTLDSDILVRKAAVSSGIAEVLLKPLRAQDVVERLTHVLQERLRKKNGHAMPTHRPHPSAGWFQKQLQAAWNEMSPPSQKAAIHHKPSPPKPHATKPAPSARTTAHHARTTHRPEHPTGNHARGALAPGEHAKPKAQVIPLRRRPSKADAGDVDGR